MLPFLVYGVGVGLLAMLLAGLWEGLWGWLDRPSRQVREAQARERQRLDEALQRGTEARLRRQRAAALDHWPAHTL